MPVTRCGRRLGGFARHRTRTRWHDGRGVGIASRDRAVDAVLIVGTITDERRDGTIDLVKQWRGHRSLIAVWVIKPSVQRLSGDECPCRVMVLSAVGVSRRMMVSEAPAS